MKATLTNGETISGKTIDEIRRQMNGMLKIEGPQGLTAVTDKGTEIHVELYEGQDYIIQAAAAALGRMGGRSTSDAKRKASAENGKLGGRPKNITD